MAAPISIVAVSRNDSHGGNIGKRMRVFVNGLIEQCRKHNLEAELIMVEWNPPADRPPLHEALPKPDPGDPLRLRYIVVPPEVHARYKRGDRIPLFQMIGKNVGIRRAKGEFVLCTNIDLLFSDQLIAFLKSGKLDKNSFYRANRVDVVDELDEKAPLDGQLAFCENPQNQIKRIGQDARLKYFYPEKHYYQQQPFWKKWLFDKFAMVTNWLRNPLDVQLYQLDSFACGDFTLMHKEAWIKIQGYVELDMYSIHIDTLGLMSAIAAGMKQVVLPADHCTYHLDHSSGWESMSDLEKIKFLEERPGLGFMLVNGAGKEMLKSGKPHNLNPVNWGFSDLDLQEYEF